MSNSTKPKSIRDGFGDGLVAIAEQNENVIALTADLESSVRMEDFHQKFPERFIQVGIAEQNMAGIAAGLALNGRIPYIGSFSSFQPMRNLDQIRTSICIMESPVKIISSHGAFSFPGDGVQIQALEDIAIMRALPNMQVVVPADYEQTKQFTQDIATIDSAVFLRIGRAEAPILSEHKLVDQELFAPAQIGKAQHLTRGSDGVIIATGYMVDNALQAAAQLNDKGYHFSVINMHTIKPLDTDAIIAAAQATGRVVTVEEHQKSGGLGSAVAEVLTEHAPGTKQKIIAVDDQFGETAQTATELWEKYGLMPADISAAALDLIN